MRQNKIIILIFLIGLSIVAYPHIAQRMNEYSQKKEVHAFQKDLSEKSSKEIADIMKRATSCNQEIFNGSRAFNDPFAENKTKLQQIKECLGVHNDSIFGAIEIPRLDLTIPIYLGATEEILNLGIGQVEGSSIPVGGKSTHTVLAGHRGMGTKEMFRNIDELKEGDIFYIHTINETLTYRVYNQEIIYPDETESLEIEENQDLATLLTCHPYRSNYQRLLIQGKRD